MWNWLRKKLGIVDHADQLIELDTKIYEIIKLISDCSCSINDCLFEIKGLEIKSNNLKQKLEQLESTVKAIPKEIVVKNVLSI